MKRYTLVLSINSREGSQMKRTFPPCCHSRPETGILGAGGFRGPTKTFSPRRQVTAKAAKKKSGEEFLFRVTEPDREGAVSVGNPKTAKQPRVPQGVLNRVGD
jgi:hypothetical protein